MIEVHKFTKRGVEEGSLKDLVRKTICWVDCLDPSEKELKEIAEVTGIASSDIRESINEEDRPKVLELDKYSLITFRAPLFNNGGNSPNEDVIETIPLSIFISKNKNNIITISRKHIRSIEKIKELVGKNTNVLAKGASALLYRILDEVLNSYFLVMEHIEEEIDQIEDAVMDNPRKATIEKIFSTKKTLIFFHKALTANREVITSIEKEYVKDIDKNNIKRFRALYSDITQLIDSAGTYRDILTGTLEIYLSSVSNNLNQVMKTLTIVASFVMVPTLISGIYGMNFAYIPEMHTALGEKYGYYFALGLMALSIGLMYAYFRRKGWM